MPKLFFVYAPPLKGRKPTKRRKVQPPFSDAPSWKCSVYYYWWEYLRRHAGYRAVCTRSGAGRMARMFSDFGNIHQTEFWDWWRTHADLFAEPSPRYVKLAEGKEIERNTALVAVPLENKASLSVRQFKKLLEPLVKAKKRAVTESCAKYPVATKPHLPSLHQHLAVWDAKQANPDIDDADIADTAGIPINQVVNGETVAGRKSVNRPYEDIVRVIRRRKQLAVQRHYRIASQYIDNVGRGKFPLRDGR